MGRILVYLSQGFLPMEALVRGIAAVQSEPIVRRGVSLYGGNDWEHCTACVIFGAKEPANRIIADQRTHNTSVLVADLGYVKRGTLQAARENPHDIYWSVNLNGLNGWGAPPRSPMPADRWDALGVEYAPWRTDSTHILVCGQKPHDAAIDGINTQQWMQDTIASLLTMTDRPIRWRPHPEDPTSRRMTVTGAKQSTQNRIEDDLHDCYAVVAFNSNALLDGLLAGIPIFILGPGSICAGMGHAALTEETLANPLQPDRAQFFADLAYRQWTIPEMETGLPWKHLMMDEPATIDGASISPNPIPKNSPPKRRGRPPKQKTSEAKLTPVDESPSVPVSDTPLPGTSQKEAGDIPDLSDSIRPAE